MGVGVLEKLSRKTGVIVGDDVLRLFEHAQQNNYAIPAVVSSLGGTFDVNYPIDGFARV